MKKRGFTLLEVLIAMMILAGAVLALSVSWNGSILGFSKTKNIQQIVGLLKKKTAELEIKYKRMPFASIPEDANGDFSTFGPEYAEYTWTAETKKLDFPDLSQSLISKEGGANDTMLSVVKQMTEFFSNSTKELKVTVIWAAPKATVQYSVVTYITNRPEKGFDFDTSALPATTGSTDPAAGTGGTNR